MNQIALPLDWPAPEDERDLFLSDANRSAVLHMERWALWPVMATILTGPRKSGRSLLARIFTTKTGGELIDDAFAQDEELLFHAWNRAQSRRRPLLIVADTAPPEWQVTLPDLRSRLIATPRIAIDEPDEALMGLLIEKLLLARGLAVPPELVRYLVPRTERTYLGIHRVIDALDEAALARRQRLSVPLARGVLTQLGNIERARQAG